MLWVKPRGEERAGKEWKVCPDICRVFIFVFFIIVLFIYLLTVLNFLSDKSANAFTTFQLDNFFSFFLYFTT